MEHLILYRTISYFSLACIKVPTLHIYIYLFLIVSVGYLSTPSPTLSCYILPNSWIVLKLEQNYIHTNFIVIFSIRHTIFNYHFQKQNNLIHIWKWIIFIPLFFENCRQYTELNTAAENKPQILPHISCFRAYHKLCRRKSSSS